MVGVYWAVPQQDFHDASQTSSYLQQPMQNVQMTNSDVRQERTGSLTILPHVVSSLAMMLENQ